MTQNYKPAYPPEFRQQMVELVALGKSPKQLSKEFVCHYTSIQAWCWAARVPIRSSQTTAPVSVLSGAPLNTSERQELLWNCVRSSSVWRWNVAYWQRPRPGLQTTRINWKGVQPIFGAIDLIADHCDPCSFCCSNTNLTARSRNSRE